MPPCSNFTAGLVLAQLCKFIPADAICCYSVLDSRLKPTVDDDINSIPIEFSKKPIEYAGKILPDYFGKLSKAVGSTASFFFELYNELIYEKIIVLKVTKFAKKHGIDRIWCVLEGQTMIRIALPVTKALDIPLHTHVWDPPGWWLRENKVNKLIAKRTLAEFDRVLRNSVTCATASWAMAKAYAESYQLPTTPVIPSLSSKFAQAPAVSINDSDKLVIGMAGQIYSSDEWTALIKALDSVNWTIGNRTVVIRFMGRYANLRAEGTMNIEYLGWRSQAETIQLMSEADILYCPYWFNTEFKEEASLSFPSKLTTYLAAGRPVLFHGPDYASPSNFLAANNAGVCCNSLNTDDILFALSELVNNKQLYSTTCSNGSIAFHKHLTLDVMKQSFADFLNLPADILLKPVESTL